MSKKRRTVSLEEKVDEYLSQDGRNASELVNKLVKKHMNGGATEDEILEFRIEQVESEVNELAGSLERKETELSELKERKEKRQAERSQEEREKIKTMAEHLTVYELRSADTPIVKEDKDVQQDLAEKADCSIEELKDEAIRQYNE